MPTNRPTQYRQSNIVARNTTATQARQNEALRLREQGMAYATIAQRLGYRAAQGASEACRAARARQGQVAQAIGTVATPAVATNRNPNVTSRTFGLEIEFFGITPSDAVTALAAVGITASYEGYTHRVSRDWKIVTDASVTSTGTGRGAGLELVSPILRGEAGLEQAAKAVTALRDAGARQNTTCGVHVHVGMDGLSGAQIMNVFDLYTKNQSNVNNLVSRSRHSNRYCRTTVPNYERSYHDNIRMATTKSEIDRLVSRLDRFVTVNLAAYAKYGTVEFRQHQGTLNGEKLTSWVKFLFSVVEAGAAGDTTEYNSLDELLTALPLANDTKGFLTRRATRLAANR